MLKEKVILVDPNDNEIGTMEKMEAHRKGELHRAFSVFIFNSNGEILIQKRSSEKYHSGGLWSNTCCSHPRKGESAMEGATRRLYEEMGMKAKLSHAFSFQYKAHLDHDLIENELDHVFIGYSNELPALNPLEVESYCYVSPELLSMGLEKHKEEYTEWLKICFDQLMNHLNKNLHYEKVG
ncbi:MAG: isopentenyl-diphosphate Delta-isomerase [Vicingaceae bacterium]|nr:isopentenyl-diphosphate Delta-isomerase [Vicingaceae bacterium]